MSSGFKYGRWIRIVAVSTLCIFFVYGVVITFFQLLPFWIDEWLLIDNMKFKSPGQLWFGLERTQQFPRVYLEIIKAFSHWQDYSYTSMRLPSFVVHTAGLILLFRLSGRIFKEDALSRFVWVMFYVSFNTSIHYFVQLKQYTMEMALSLVGIWQLLELFADGLASNSRRYWLLCLSFLICPFFSYTYPIVVTPIYLLAFVELLRTRKLRGVLWLPLLIGMISIAVFYVVDVQQVLADPGMQDFWQEQLMKEFSWDKLLDKGYMTFTNLGSGDLFGNIVGVLGVLSFFYCTFLSARQRFMPADSNDLLVHYSCLLVWVTFVLFFVGKLPLGTFRLNSFAVPAMGFMILHMLARIRNIPGWRLGAEGLLVVIFLAMVGNVFVTMAELTTDEHAKKLRIYHATDRAIVDARKGSLPMLVTSGIAFPFDDRWPGDWILKTHPQYKVNTPLQVEALPSVDSIAAFLQRLPDTVQAAVVLHGDSIVTVRK